MLYRHIVSGANTSYRLGTDVGYVNVLLSSTASQTWVGMNAVNTIASHNYYKPNNPIRGIEDAFKMTYTVAGGSSPLTVSFDSYGETSTNAVKGNNFAANPLAFAVYSYQGQWTNVGTTVSSGSFIVGNTSGIDFRAQGVVDFPTEGWTIQNTTTLSDWALINQAEQEQQQGPYVVPSINIQDPFSITPSQTRGFSLIGAGGDIINHIQILPTSGEGGVNPYQDRTDVLGDGIFGGYDYNFNVPYEEEMGAFEGTDEYAVYDGLDEVSGRHASFRTTYDQLIDKVLIG